MKRFLCRYEMMAGLIVLLLVFFCSVSSATAVSVSYTGVVEGQYVSVYDSVYAGAYTLSMDGQEILGMCDDYTAHVPGQNIVWEAHYYSYNQAVIGELGRWSEPGDTDNNNYDIIGYLFSQAFDSYGNFIKNNQELAAINLAIWNVFNDRVDFDTSTIGIRAADLLERAMAAFVNGFDNYAWREWMYFLTPAFEDGVPVSQEFLVRGTAPVPEPATMLLLGTGLIGLAGVGRKKFLK